LQDANLKDDSWKGGTQLWGNVRDNELYDKNKYFSFEKLVRCDSLMSPSKEFPAKFRYSKLDSKLMVLGRMPVILLLDKSSSDNMCLLHNEEV
jgi:hypothetical protein